MQNQGWFRGWPLLLIVVLQPWSAVHAEDLRYAATQPYLTGGFAYTIRDHRRVSGNGVGAYLGGGIAIDQYWGYEADILYNSFSAHEPNGARWDSWGGRFNGLFFIDRNPNFEPFLQAGVGAVRNHSLDLHRQTAGVLGTAGVGAMSFFPMFGQAVAVRVDALYQFEHVNADRFDRVPNQNGAPFHLQRNSFREPVIEVGLVIPLGGPPEPPVAAAAPPPPAPPPAPSVVEGVPVQAAPPPCNPPAGFKVDANCHIIEQTVIMRAIDFEYDKATLTGPARDTLDEVANALRAQQPPLYVEIDGHTDSRGSVRYNQRLSQRRAESVRAYLISRGLDGGHLTAHGFGKSRPIASNATPAGRAQNRRVEFKVMNAPPDLKVVGEGATSESHSAAMTGERRGHGGEGGAPHKRHRHHHPAATPPPQ